MKLNEPPVRKINKNKIIDCLEKEQVSKITINETNLLLYNTTICVQIIKSMC